MASVNEHESLLNDIVNQNQSSINNIKCLDTRNEEMKPSSYKPMLRTDFKSKNISGLNDTYSGILTFRPYGNTGDWTGGPVHQLGFDGTHGLYHRFSTGDTSWSGWKKIWLQGDTITNAVWNDYAERFEKPVELKTEPGDIIALDKSTETEMYKLAEEGDSNIVGVHSDEYGMLIGGVADDEEYNKKHFIPVGMIGRVRTKVIGPIHKGDRIVPSNIPGVGRIFENGDNMFAIVGFATETNLDPNVKKVRTKINTY